ncbi:DNA mismatch repair protein MutS [Novosphingobium endophyticum]|uniref:DNA mismatch repair protein MutS n=1 Tax=Novosphingobium endophyticum TaxID=1955250 RepID=A0A916X6F9_9SPHN|nr:DNA mismatch repair protein MutS [Novosphingobium endophyticum]
MARTVTPLVRRKVSPSGAEGEHSPPKPHAAPVPGPAPTRKVKGRVPPPLPPAPVPAKPASEDRAHLDGSWERRISKGTLIPDFHLDLHGANLETAYRRLMHGLTQAKAMGARVVLIVTGKPRPVDAMDRGERRGAIRAKISDWLAASEHAGDIVAIRGAHRRHGGAGALYVVLKRRR